MPQSAPENETARDGGTAAIRGRHPIGAEIDDHYLMSDLDVSDIKRIAQEAALEHSLPLEIVGVLLGGEGSEYVEILVNIDGCAVPPCQLAIGIFRNTPEAELRREIGTRLRRHLDDHHGTRERKE